MKLVQVIFVVFLWLASLLSVATEIAIRDERIANLEFKQMLLENRVNDLLPRGIK